MPITQKDFPVLSVFKIINEAMPWLRRELFLAQPARADKLRWIAGAFTRQYEIPPDTALFLVRRAVTDCAPERFETMEALSRLAAEAAASLHVPPPSLCGWHTIH